MRDPAGAGWLSSGSVGVSGRDGKLGGFVSPPLTRGSEGAEGVPVVPPAESAAVMLLPRGGG